MTAKKTEKTVGATVSHRVATIRKTAEKQVREGFDRALSMLPPAPRKAVKELTANVEKARKDLRKRTDALIKDVTKRTERAAGDVRKRVEGVVAPISKRVEGVVAPLTKRFDVASRAEVERLRKRLDQLEKRLEAKAEHKVHEHKTHEHTVAA